MSSSLSPGTYVNGVVSGSFDVSAHLSPGYGLVSASVSFSFYDNADALQVSSSDTGSSLSGHDHYQYYTVSHVDPYEAALVTFGDQVIGGNSNYYASSSTSTKLVFVDPFICPCGLFGSSVILYYDYYYTVTQNDFDGYTGGFGLGQTLSPVSLADLGSDGLLNFSINPTGDFVFGGATLTADVQATSVPEPASLLLVGSGLVGAAWRLRRRNP